MDCITHIKTPLHLLNNLDIETAIILSFLYEFRRPFAVTNFGIWIGIKWQRAAKKINEHPKYFIKSKIITKDLRVFTTYSLSEEVKTVYEDIGYFL